MNFIHFKLYSTLLEFINLLDYNDFSIFLTWFFNVIFCEQLQIS